MKKFVALVVLMLSMLLIVHEKAYAAENYSVEYSTHVQNIGWQNSVKDGALSGTEGKALRVEALKINVTGGLQVRYQAHVQNIGWQDWVSGGAQAGTSGKSLRIEALKIELVNAPQGVHVEYQAHVQNVGWTNWVKDGQVAGSIGESLRIEAIKIRIVKDQIDQPDGQYEIAYKSHVQDVGWQAWTKDSELSGTTGRNLRIESLKINVSGGLKVRYQAHVQNMGWQGWVNGGGNVGTEGKSLRIEALKIELIDAPQGTHVEYQVHVQNIGWMDWVRDGQVSGTVGNGLRIEAMRIKITREQVPTYNLSYQTQVQDIGWQGFRNQGEISGTTGSDLRLEAIQLKTDSNATFNLIYQTQVQSIGWQDWVGNGETAGSVGKSLNMEAIRIKANNLDNEHVLIYKTYVRGIGWQNWVKDGQISGTVGLNIPIEAIQVKIVTKSEAKALLNTKIAVDIGHNTNYDSGAIGIRVEDQLTMEVGTRVIRKLRERGYTVIETLPTNASSTTDSLNKRTTIANSNEVDLFTSIHFNKFDGNANGTEIYYKQDSSKNYATNVLNKIVSLGFYDRGIKFNDTFYVLKNTNMPAILIETCFVDSQKDMILYNADNIANKIVEGLTQ